MARILTLVIAWDCEQRGPLAIRLAVNLRDARRIAEELQKEYEWSLRVSILKEVEAYTMPLHPDAPNQEESFLHEDGWEVEWVQEQEDAKGGWREEERERKGGW